MREKKEEGLLAHSFTRFFVKFLINFLNFISVFFVFFSISLSLFNKFFHTRSIPAPHNIQIHKYNLLSNYPFFHKGMCFLREKRKGLDFSKPNLFEKLFRLLKSKFAKQPLESFRCISSFLLEFKSSTHPDPREHQRHDNSSSF